METIILVYGNQQFIGEVRRGDRFHRVPMDDTPSLIRGATFERTGDLDSAWQLPLFRVRSRQP